jgi:hypothetical protein
MPEEKAPVQSTVGKINVYTCAVCGYHTVTIDVDEGVTPFSIRCPACPEGSAHSNFYKAPQHYAPEMEWFKPTEEELRQLTRRELAESPEDFAAEVGFDKALELNREHLNKGGLFLRHVRKETLRRHHASADVRGDYLRVIANY